ncbi:MAG: DUF4389 domain-containing protein [Dehalococcoidia bacterium]|nr:DUF4389 domain-containing protein [Dehalococcoidia bacterium]
MATMAASGSLSESYPVDLQVDPPQSQSRLTIFFRGWMLIPHQIILAVLAFVAGIVQFIALLAILFTGKMPAGLANFLTGYLHWNTRVNGYQFLLTGAYPPFSMDPAANYPVRLIIEPKLEGRNRITAFFRGLLIIPNIIVLAVVAIAAMVVYAVAWLVALFTGSVPLGMHNFIAGFVRWLTRVTAYIYLLVDDYPPFSMS